MTKGEYKRSLLLCVVVDILFIVMMVLSWFAEIDAGTLLPIIILGVYYIHERIKQSFYRMKEENDTIDGIGK